MQANDVQLRGDKMTTRPSIKNEQEHKTALAAIEQLLESEPGTPQGIEFEILARLIEEYELVQVSRIACEPKFLKKLRKCSRPSSSKYTLLFLSSVIVMLSIDF